MRKQILGIFVFTFLLGICAPLSAKAEKFFVEDNFDILGRSGINADLRIEGEKNKIFVESDFFNDLTDAQKDRLAGVVFNLSTEFDGKIYPRLREVFGEERSPGIDNDTKITILLHETMPGIGGYVREEDGYSRAEMPTSNGREMLYVDVDQAMNSTLGPSFVAHEFQHLITFNQKKIVKGLSEERWLNEARSEYAPTIVGYDDEWRTSYLKKRVDEILGHPSDGLLDWRGRSIDHASNNLFIHFLVDKYGMGVLSEMMQSDTVGIDSIEQAISNLGYSVKFEDIYTDWDVSLFVNNITSNSDMKFQYKFPNLSFGNLHVLPSSTFRLYDNNASGATFLIDNWSAQWHRFFPGSIAEESALHIRILSEDSKNLAVYYVINDFFGGTNVHRFNLGESSILTISDFGNFVSSVTIIPMLTVRGVDNISKVGAFSIEGFVSNTFADQFAEGSLISAEDDAKVYIVKRGTKIGETFIRWIQTPEVFRFYKHLKWNDIITVKPEFLASFEESFLVRRSGDYKVYEIDRQGRKKWLNITSAEFERNGYKWDAIYEVNQAEWEWYK